MIKVGMSQKYMRTFQILFFKLRNDFAGLGSGIHNSAVTGIAADKKITVGPH